MTSGLVQSLSLLAEVLFEPGDAVWVENPGYTTVEEVFRFSGLKTVPVPVDDGGLDLERALEIDRRAKGVFVSSASQYPLSVPLVEKRAQDLLDWASATGGWIIEDRTDGILSLENPNVRPSLQWPEFRDGLVYVESFSLLIAPDFRLGYIVLPQAFAETCTAAKFLTDRSLGEAAQAVLAEFLDSEFYDGFIRRLNRRYRQRFSMLKKR